MKLLIAFAYLLSLLQCVSAWKGTQITLTQPLVSINGEQDDTGLYATVTTGHSLEKVLLTANIVVKSSAALQQMTFTLYRGTLPVSGIPVQAVMSQYADEMQPVVITYVDSPGLVGTHVYSLYVDGTGELSPVNIPRQMSAIVMSTNYITSVATSTATVRPPDFTLSLSTTVAANATTSRVMLFLNMYCGNLTQALDVRFNFLKSGGIVGTLQSYGLGQQISTNLAYMDTAGTLAPITYTVSGSRLSGASTSTWTAPQLAAIVIPSQQQSSVLSVATNAIVSTTWMALPLSASASSASNPNFKVLLRFTADLLFNSPSATTACFTIFRGGVNLGDATYGLLAVNPGPRLNARRNPMIVWMDAPGVAGTTFVYTVYVKSLEGFAFTIGQYSTQSSLSAVVVSDNYLSPSIAPTVMPSPVPTAQPSAPVPSCVTGCTIIGSGLVNVGGGNTPGSYFMPRYFKLTFQVSGVTLAANNAVRNNILDFKDVPTGNSLLAVFVTESTNLQVRYNGIITSPYSVLLDANYPTTYTTITITVLESKIIVGSSQDAGWNAEYPIVNINPAGVVYRVCTSNSVYPTSGGVVTNMAITGTQYYSCCLLIF